MATPLGNSVSLTGTPQIDGLTQGSKWGLPASGTLTISIWDSQFGTWTNEAPQEILNIVNNFSNVANINFSFFGHFPLTSEGSFDPAFSNNSSDISILPTGNILSTEFGAVALAFFPDPVFVDLFLISLGIDPSSYPTAEGDIFIDNFSFVFNAENFVPGGIGYTLALHEAGHALGLKHPHDEGGNDRPTFLELGIGSFDNQLFTVMSYNLIGTASTGNPATLMPFDILALQNIYGANTSFHTGNDVYPLLDDGIVRTIWDAGGVDTFDASGLTSPVLIDLNEFGYSFHGTFSVTAIAFDTTIENAIGGSAADLIIGNSAANGLFGNEGNDILFGGLGEDFLQGNTGNDFVQGNQGDDTVRGGQGDDTVRGGQGNDVALGDKGNDNVFGDIGADVVFGGPDVDFVQGNTGNDFVQGNQGDDTVRGGQGDDIVRGGQGNDVLFGDKGNDDVLGDKGNDVLFGGPDFDTFIFGESSGQDVIADFELDVDLIAIASNVNGSGIFSEADALAQITTDVFGDAVFDLGGGNTVTLVGVDPSTISEADILIF